MILLSLVIDFLICVAGAKEAWGYSMSSYKGIQSIFGKKLDHLPWVIERSIWVFVIVLSFRMIGDYFQLAIIMICFLLKFMFLHQLAYNSTMAFLKIEGYAINIRESINTTANIKSSKYFKVFLFLSGMAVLLLRELLIFKIILIFHAIK